MTRNKIESTQDDANWLADQFGAITTSMPDDAELAVLTERFNKIRDEEFAKLASDERTTNALIMLELDLAGTRTSKALEAAKLELDETFRLERLGEDVSAARGKVLVALRIAIAKLAT